MKTVKLRNVALSNVRTYGVDVRIELAEHVTLLLAPNGTGKSTFFEGVELALTGGVARLGSDLRALIREGASSAQVTLEFSDGLRSARLLPGEPTRLEGDLDMVLGAPASGDLPYLLRLTHLLDQRDTQWFVHAEEGQAGEVLGRLPLGRYAALAGSALLGARRAATRAKRDSERRMAVAETALRSWRDLVRERDELLRGLSHSNAAQNGNIEVQLAVLRQREWAAQVDAGSIRESVDVQAGRLAVMLEAHQRALRSQVERLSRADVVANAHPAASNLYDAALATRASLLVQLDAARERLVRVRGELRQADASHRAVELEYANSTEARRRVAERTAAQERQDAARVAVRRSADDANAARARVASARSTYDAIRAAVAKLRDADERERALREREQQLTRVTHLMVVQSDFVGRAALLQVGVTEATGALAASRATRDAHEEQRVARARAVEDERSALEHTKERLGSVRAAIATIAAEISQERGDCPLCGVEHGPDELHRRVAAAMAALDPAVDAAASRLLAAESALQAANRTAEESRRRAAMDEAKLAKLQNELEGCEQELARLEHLLRGDAELTSRLEREVDDIAKSRASLAELRAALEASISQDQEALARSDLVNAETELARASRDLHVAEVDLANAEREVAVIDLQLSGAADEPSLNQRVLEAVGKLRGSRERLDALRIEAAQGEAVVFERERELAHADRTVRHQLAILQQLADEWIALAFEGTPHAAVVQEQRDAVALALSRANDDATLLEEVLQEASRRKHAVSLQAVQDRLAGVCGGRSPEDYEEELVAQIGVNSLEIATWEDVSNAMGELSSKLDEKLENVHGAVLSIQPRWQALLRTVVRESRFVSAGLEFYRHYGRQQAGTTVPLHSRRESVARVASEAQTTDLQLTFLMAMALGHAWCPWRALLLDDPTQHHDLVHASSVFDLLRDYVAEHDFQVVLATHDAVQARFFKRKLENDGLSVKTYLLEPSTNGVCCREDV